MSFNWPHLFSFLVGHKLMVCLTANDILDARRDDGVTDGNKCYGETQHSSLCKGLRAGDIVILKV